MGWMLKSSTTNISPDPEVTAGYAKGLYFSPDGHRLYIHALIGYGTQAVLQYDLPTPWDIHHYTDSTYTNIGADISLSDAPSGLPVALHPNGLVLYTHIGGFLTPTIVAYNLMTMWDVSSRDPEAGAWGYEIDHYSVVGFWWSPDGTVYLEIDRDSGTIYLYHLETAWSLGSRSLSESYTLDANGVLAGMWMDQAGSYILTINQETKSIIKITLPVPWSLAEATHAVYRDFSRDQDDIPYATYDIWDIASNPDGSLVTLIAMATEDSGGWQTRPLVLATYAISGGVPWPETLPAPQRSGLKIVPLSDVLHRRSQSGRKELRRWGKSQGDLLTCTLRLATDHPVHGDQVAIFSAFFDKDLDFGTQWIEAEWLSGDSLGYAGCYGRLIGYTPRKASVAKHEYDLTVLIRPASAV